MKSKYTYTKFCDYCGNQFFASRSDKKYCDDRCYNSFMNAKAKRISTKLTPQQREVIIALQDYFIGANR